MADTPRGIRNNNPGNIRKSNDPWQGLSPEQNDPDFFQFTSPTYGIRAIARILITYQDNYSCVYAGDFIDRWAPPSENNTGAYKAAVLKSTGFAPTAKVDMHAYADCSAMVEAIIHQENGEQPYDGSVIDKGLLLAGVEPPKKSLLKSTQIRASIVAAAATAAPYIPQAAAQAGSLKDSIAPLIDFADWLKPAFVLVSLTAIGLGMAARIQQRRKGIA